MLTAAQRNQFRQADADLDALTVRQVLALLASLDVDAQRDFIEGLLDTVPGIVAELGDVSALLGSSMYELAREQSEARGRFTVNLADPPGVTQVQESLRRWVFAPLFYADLERPVAVQTVTKRLVATAPRLVREGGRQTIVENTRRDPARPKYRRVVNNPAGCDFCRQLAGRGSVYHSEDSAGAGRHFHDNCKCTVQLEF